MDLIWNEITNNDQVIEHVADLIMLKPWKKNWLYLLLVLLWTIHQFIESFFIFPTYQIQS